MGNRVKYPGYPAPLVAGVLAPIGPPSMVLGAIFMSLSTL